MGRILRAIAYEKTEKVVDPNEKLAKDIREICKEMECAYSVFEQEADEDLIDAAIYRLEALKAKYRYLIRQAKSQNLQTSALPCVYKADEG